MKALFTESEREGLRESSRRGLTYFTFPGDTEDDPDWKVEVDYGEDGEFAQDPWFTFYKGNIWYGQGQLGFKQGGVGGGHGPSHPSRAVYGPYVRPHPDYERVKGGGFKYRVPKSVEAYALKWAHQQRLIDAPSGTFVHPRGRKPRRKR